MSVFPLSTISYSRGRIILKCLCFLLLGSSLDLKVLVISRHALSFEHQYV